jgi:serine/threonine protein phosphatase PrpC
MSTLPLSAPSSADIVACPECAEENTPTELYCVACGASLQSETQDETPPCGLEPLPPETVFADHYVIETVHAAVRENRYRARQQNGASARVVLRERASADAEPFRVLATQTEGIHHPALLLPEQYLEQDGRAYLVGPEATGIRLAERIGKTTEREAVTWGVQLCQAVGFLHRHGLLCLELPPETVLLDKDGRVRLTHFDNLIPKEAEHNPESVTDGYAAPEAYKPGALGEQTDVFALGALLYTLLVGKRLPVEGWVVQPDPPVFYPDKVMSPGLERVLRKSLLPEAQDRYANLDALKTALLALSQVSKVRSAWLTDVGQVRDHNEDAVFVHEWGQGTVTGTEFCGLYVVADGMGGAEAGEVASALTIRTIADAVSQAWQEGSLHDDTASEACLRGAGEAANAAILAYVKEHRESSGMGSTVVAALIRGQQLIIAWVGDSRVYLWEHGQLQQLSRDHSLVARLVEIGQVSAEEARTHEHRNVLIRSLGTKEQVVVDTLRCPFRRGARLLLCSDGLTTHLEDPSIADILSRHRDPSEATLELVVAANSGGGTDNISTVVVFHE